MEPHIVHAAITLALFGMTLAGVLTRPRGIAEAWFAVGGALLMLVFRLVTPAEAWRVTRESGDVLLFLLFLMALSALVDTSGFFDWAATWTARAAKGSGRRLLVGVFLLGAVITTLLSLDTTALLLTPLVWAVADRAKLPPKPYAFACAFVANIASSALPVANLTNLLAFGRLHTTTAHYALIMAPATVLCSLTALGMVLWVFRRDIPARFDADAFPDPMDAVPDLPYFRATLCVLALTLVGYFVGPGLFHLPLWVVAAGSAGLLLLAGKLTGRVRARTIATRGIAWSVFPFIIGMFVVIRGAENIGLSTWLGHGLLVLGGPTVGGQIFATAFGTGIGANLLNNILMLLLALTSVPAGATATAPLYAAVLGCNLGPNITVVGSLATMLWRSVLRQKGLEISSGELARAGTLVTVPALVVACLALWAALIIFGGT